MTCDRFAFVNAFLQAAAKLKKTKTLRKRSKSFSRRGVRQDTNARAVESSVGGEVGVEEEEEGHGDLRGSVDGEV